MLFIRAFHCACLSGSPRSLWHRESGPRGSTTARLAAIAHRRRSGRRPSLSVFVLRPFCLLAFRALGAASVSRAAVGRANLGRVKTANNEMAARNAEKKRERRAPNGKFCSRPVSTSGARNHASAGQAPRARKIRKKTKRKEKGAERFASGRSFLRLASIEKKFANDTHR